MGNYREMSERKARTRSYDDPVHLLIELARERENDSDMDKPCANICEGRPLLRRDPQGCRHNQTLTQRRAEVDS